MSDYMEAVARKQKLEPPSGYGYKADVALGVGCWLEEHTGVQVLEKPVCIPSGKKEVQGYIMLFGYCGKDGMEHILQGGLPPQLPATQKEPREFSSMAHIADNFGNKDPQAAASNSAFCVAFRVPADIAHKVDTPGRDIWMIRFDQNIVAPYLQAVKEGSVEKVKGALSNFPGDVFDEEGVSALMMAAFGGWDETCQALINNKADVNAHDPAGLKTPLMFAAQGGHSKMVSQLLAANADPSKADQEGLTPLMWAAVAGKTEVAKVLKPVSPLDAVTKEGQYPGLNAKQLAEKMNHKDVLAVLS